MATISTIMILFIVTLMQTLSRSVQISDDESRLKKSSIHSLVLDHAKVFIGDLYSSLLCLWIFSDQRQKGGHLAIQGRRAW